MYDPTLSSVLHPEIKNGRGFNSTTKLLTLDQGYSKVPPSRSIKVVTPCQHSPRACLRPHPS